MLAIYNTLESTRLLHVEKNVKQMIEYIVTLRNRRNKPTGYQKNKHQFIQNKYGIETDKEK